MKTKPTFETRQAAWRHFQLEKWGPLKLAALKLAMQECVKTRQARNAAYLQKLRDRWGIGRALEYYADNPELYWDD
jgi:hypothetical protein